MQLLRGFQHLPGFDGGTVATIGNFDGVHRGHQALLAALRAEASRMNLPMVVVLFEPQPGEYFYSDKAPSRLTSLREKLDVLRHVGVDYVCCLKFDKRLSVMPASEFAEQIIFTSLQIKSLLIGHDFRFGSNRSGDVALLNQLAKKFGAVVHAFPDYSIANERVSSTKIRLALLQGDLRRAESFLGRTFGLCGRVIQGDGRGRQWGVPTANLGLHRINLPLKGVFCVQVKRAGAPLMSGVANLGSRPTVDGTKNILEIHLFDFNESLYGEVLQVFFLHKLRDEIKFPSVDVLIAQIHDDVITAKAYFATVHPEINDFVE